ncbi:hypothetical protein AMECASPLE_036915 [Ameca splendens]|uniref:Uncharacterized protein n=1 Tax=Ameca splendens TaxID=208324 RepID=A0ABV0YJI5_9TELE
MDFNTKTLVRTFLELFKIKCINLLPAQPEKGITADFGGATTQIKAQLRRGEGGSRGLPTMTLPAYKPPPFHKSPSFHTALERDRSGEAQRADVFCWQKDIKFNWIQEAIRSSIICKVK